jgi:hypothetical protein
MMSEKKSVPRRAPALERLNDYQHLLVIEGNPLTANELAMFEMFEREKWTPEQRRAHIIAQFVPASLVAE